MKSLQTEVANKGATPGTLVIDEAMNIGEGETITIPETLLVQVVPPGKITFAGSGHTVTGPQLTINGPFEAGLYPIFEFETDSKATQPVYFGPRSVKEVVTLWFGAIPDEPSQPSPSDSHLAIQRAVYSASAVSRIYMPRGKYWIQDTIHLDVPVVSAGSPFISYVLEGARPAMAAAGLNPRTVIHAEFKDRPAINIGLGRDTQVKNLSIIGKNEKASEVYLSDSETDYADQERCKKNVLPTDWIDEDTTAGRHNPYCAIATDAYGVTPKLHPTYYGDEDRYAQRPSPTSGTAQVLIEGVEIEKFVAGVAISPSGAPQNDMIRIQRSVISGCAYGIAIGSTQARGCHIKDNWIKLCYVAIDNVAFGEDEPKPASKVNCTSNIYSKCRNLYHLVTSSNGPAQFSGEYAENFIQLGQLGLGGNIQASGSSTVFSGCDYAFSTRVKTMRLFGIQGTATFIGCDFRVYGDEERSKDFYFSLSSDSSNLVFQSCSFQVNCNDAYPRFFMSQYADWSKIHFRDCSLKRIKGINVPGCGKRKKAQLPELRKREQGDLSEVTLRLSDEQVANLGGATKAIRLDLHGNSQTLRVRRSTGIYSFFNLKYTESIQPFLAIKGKLNKLDDYSVTFEQRDVGSFLPGDRVYCSFYLKEYPHKDGQLKPTEATTAFSGLKLPLLEVTEVVEAKVTARIPDKLDVEVQLPSNFELNQPYVAIMPRVKNTPYVILNGGVRGKFIATEYSVTEVSNIELLRVGDLVNGEFTKGGTRIREIKVVEKTILLSQVAIKSSIDDASIPVILLKKV